MTSTREQQLIKAADALAAHAPPPDDRKALEEVERYPHGGRKDFSELAREWKDAGNGDLYETYAGLALFHEWMLNRDPRPERTEGETVTQP